MGEVDALFNPEPKETIVDGELDIDLFRDPVWFCEHVLHDPETGEPFKLYDQQKRFLRAAFTLDEDGRLPHPELLFSACKKSGKTATAGMAILFVTVALAGPYGEALVFANDEEQSKSRVFQAAARMVEASPSLRASANVFQSRIEFPATGSTITALGSDYASAAGSNANIVCFDELWGFRSESFRRLFDELVPPPTRRVACRLTTTYAGYEGESQLLTELTARGLKGTEIAPELFASDGMLTYHTHERRAPWQSETWVEQMRATLRPNSFLRLIENREGSSEDSFVDLELWDKCVDLDASPILTDRNLQVVIGVDASVKRDSTALALCSFDSAAQKVRLISHRIFQPSPDDPLDFEATIEAALLDYAQRFDVRSVLYDPFRWRRRRSG